MTDDVKPTPQAGEGESVAHDEARLEDLPAAWQDEVRKLRKESAERRVAAKNAERERAAAEEARLREQQEWKTLAEKHETRLKELAPRADRLDVLEQYLVTALQTRIDAIPTQYRGMVPEYDDPVKTLAWLDANAGLLALPRPPQTDAGQQGDRAKSASLSAEEQAAARLAGMTDAQYAEYKAKRAQANDRDDRLTRLLHG